MKEDGEWENQLKTWTMSNPYSTIAKAGDLRENTGVTPRGLWLQWFLVVKRPGISHHASLCVPLCEWRYMHACVRMLGLCV